MKSSLIWLDRNVDRLSEQPFMAWLWMSIIGGGALVIAGAINVSSVSFVGDIRGIPKIGGLQPGIVKEVGYYAALNWSLFGGAVQPLIVFFALRTRSCVPILLRELADTGMVRDEHFNRVDSATILANWNIQRDRLRWIYLVIIILSLVVVGSDWLGTVAKPLFNPSVYSGISITHPEYEFDWSVCATFARPCTPMWVDLLFGIAVYILIAFIGTVFGFFLMVGGAASIFFACGLMPVRTSQGAPPLRWRLVAMPTDRDDHRCGFGVFSLVFSSILAGALAVAFGLYLMVLQNAYLRAGTLDAGQDIVHFLLGDFKTLAGMWLAPNGLPKFPPPITDLYRWAMQPFYTILANHNIEYGIVFYWVTWVISIGSCYAVLRHVAKSGRDFARAHVNELAAETGEKPSRLRNRLDDMVFWPVGWTSLNEMLSVLLILLLTFFSYRIALVVGFYVLARFSWRFFSGLIDGIRQGNRRRDRNEDDED